VDDFLYTLNIFTTFILGRFLERSFRRLLFFCCFRISNYQDTDWGNQGFFHPGFKGVLCKKNGPNISSPSFDFVRRIYIGESSGKFN
jgi:hypothetical protein